MLELVHLSKSYPGVKALDDVSLSFAAGEVHALLGENGAGKSTLLKAVCGIHQADSGEIRLNGTALHLHGIADAQAQGIGIVNQEIQVVPGATIAENLMLDRLTEGGSAARINWRHINAEAKRCLELVGLDLPVTMLVDSLSAAHKQMLQIAKVLARDVKVLLLDEPTSSLTDHEAATLFALVAKVKARGVTVIFISHKLEEVFAICDRVSVLRDGQFIGTKNISDITTDDVVRMMIGRDGGFDEHLGLLPIDHDTTVLEARKLCRGNAVRDVSFELKKGEILGFYGLVGAGRTETARLLFGADPRDSGTILVNGVEAQINSVADALHRYRIGYVSENRKEGGVFLDESISDNICITVWQRLAAEAKQFISPSRERQAATSMVDAMKIKVTNLGQLVGTLSGGNQQKVSIGKWLLADCDVLIIDEPSIGVDVGAKESIHHLIWDLAKNQGKSIIVISSDMPELINLARRIVVFKEGRIVGELDDLNEAEHSYEAVSERIGALMA
ncbi:MAG: sugar ABC transporter ATP-binding protein [Planctomycetota bacterium]|jgi:ribose transport system ATP-binding protein